MQKSRLLSFVLCLLLFSCGKAIPELKDIDLSEWKNDSNGCNGYRSSTQTSLQTQRDVLLGLDEMQLVSLLGRPDEQELYKRNQKFYYYHLTASSLCDPPVSISQRLIIRFNAVGLAKEVIIE